MSVNINNIKTQIKSILDTANDVAASYDLSTNMTNRVQTVWKQNPEILPIQATLFPLVTIYLDNKSIQADTIARNQATGKRKATIVFKIYGATYNSAFTNVYEDIADNDIEYLMENIEEILRSNGNLNGTVGWAIPTNVDYISGFTEDESAFVRAAMMDLNITIYY